MIPSNTRYLSDRFNDTCTSEKPLLDEHSLSSPPLSPDSVSSQLATEQRNIQFSYELLSDARPHLNEVSSESEFDEELRIRVDGIPDSGAKSRVETQIKLLISLTTKRGSKIPYWSYIRISESLLATSKLRKSQQQKLLDGSAATMVSDDSKILDLEARVVCETDENKIIQMCQGCVRRERKRAGRKKDAKPSYYNMDSKTSKEAFERDRKRVLLFNCERLVNFSMGEAIIPTRITCYCRHHNEPIGFRVRFTLKNGRGTIIATGESPPIMVTDDHKGSKERSPTMLNTKKRKRATSTETNEDAYCSLATPASSRRNSACENDLNNTASGSYFPDLNINSSSVLGAAPLATSLYNDSVSSSPSTPVLADLWQDLTVNSTSCAPFHLPITDKSNLHHGCTSTSLASSPSTPINEFSPPSRQKVQHAVTLGDTNLINPLQYNVDIALCPPMTPSPPILLTSAQAALVPVLDRIEPPLGPTMGGTEIAIIGQNFDAGLTIMFGDHPATTLSCTPNTIVCLLPIMDKPGPVILSFKEHSFLRTCPEPPLFSYYETGLQNMIDLALEASFTQIPAIERQHILSQTNIEMEVIHILSQQHYMDVARSNMCGQNLLHLAAHLNYSRLAHLLMTRNSALVHTQDRNGLTPLHFACLSRSAFAIEVLLNAGAHIDTLSNFGTPLQMLGTREFEAL